LGRKEGQKGEKNKKTVFSKREREEGKREGLVNDVFKSPNIR